MYENITPFEEAGWDSGKDDGGLNCDTMTLLSGVDLEKYRF